MKSVEDMRNHKKVSNIVVGNSNVVVAGEWVSSKKGWSTDIVKLCEVYTSRKRQHGNVASERRWWVKWCWVCWKDSLPIVWGLHVKEEATWQCVERKKVVGQVVLGSSEGFTSNCEVTLTKRQHNDGVTVLVAAMVLFAQQKRGRGLEKRRKKKRNQNLKIW